MGDFQHGGENPLAPASAGAGGAGSRRRGRVALGAEAGTAGGGEWAFGKKGGFRQPHLGNSEDAGAWPGIPSVWLGCGQWGRVEDWLLNTETGGGAEGPQAPTGPWRPRCRAPERS